MSKNRKLEKGLELLAEQPGSGPAAGAGDTVTYNARFFLRRGAEVTQDFTSISRYRARFQVRAVDGVELIDHETELGRRRPIAAVEKSLVGMQAGGFREVLASAHFCFGKKGLGNAIPPDAMLRIQLWLRKISKSQVVESSK